MINSPRIIKQRDGSKLANTGDKYKGIKATQPTNTEMRRRLWPPGKRPMPGGWRSERRRYRGWSGGRGAGLGLACSYYRVSKCPLAPVKLDFGHFRNYRA